MLLRYLFTTFLTFGWIHFDWIKVNVFAAFWIWTSARIHFNWLFFIYDKNLVWIHENVDNKKEIFCVIHLNTFHIRTESNKFSGAHHADSPLCPSNPHKKWKSEKIQIFTHEAKTFRKSSRKYSIPLTNRSMEDPRLFVCRGWYHQMWPLHLVYSYDQWLIHPNKFQYQLNSSLDPK